MNKNDECRSKKIVGFDLFRTILALITLFFHSIIHLECYYGILHPFLSMGAISMTGFFMLSGFIIQYMYKDMDFSDSKILNTFYIKRVAGIIPSYYFVSILYIIFLDQTDIMKRILLIPIEILGIQTVYTSLFDYSHNNGTWFVSCILQCYMVYPLLNIIIKNVSKKIRYILLFMSISVLFYSPIIVGFFGLYNIYSNCYFRILEFLIGIIIADLLEKCQKKNIFLFNILRKKLVIFSEFIVLLLSVSVAVSVGIPRNYMLYSWICLPLFILIIISLRICDLNSNKIFVKIISHLSGLSYAFFLTQFFVWPTIKLTIRVIPNMNNLEKIAASIIFCYIFSLLLHNLVEIPCKRIILNKYNQKMINYRKLR